jgi:hypothetical protein
MSFNQLSYDPATYKRDLAESLAQGQYQMFSGYGQVESGTCMMNAPFGQAHDQTPFAKLVDQESELLNLTRPLTKNPMEEYPFKQSDVSFNNDMVACNTSSESQHSRYTPFNERKDIQIIRNNNEGLCQDPQSLNRIPSNTRSGMNTRLLYRDNFKQTETDNVYLEDSLLTPSQTSRTPLESFDATSCNSCTF